MAFSSDRSLHSRNVALWMQAHAEEFGVDPSVARATGWLHDYGWFDGNNRTHAGIGAGELEVLGLDKTICNAIRQHGNPTADRTTDRLLLLLDTADMTIDSTGTIVGFDGRLSDVAARYGVDSVQYADCLKVISACRMEIARLGLDYMAMLDS